MLLLSLFPPPPASLLSYSGHRLGRYLGEEEWLLCQEAVDLSGDEATTYYLLITRYGMHHLGNFVISANSGQSHLPCLFPRVVGRLQCYDVLEGNLAVFTQIKMHIH